MFFNLDLSVFLDSMTICFRKHTLIITTPVIIEIMPMITAASGICL